MPRQGYGTRKIDGKSYKLVDSWGSARAAQEDAQIYRRRGFNARIIAQRGKYTAHFYVYVREKGR